MAKMKWYPQWASFQVESFKQYKKLARHQDESISFCSKWNLVLTRSYLQIYLSFIPISIKKQRAHYLYELTVLN